jgi:raffinose/stachyose/melibiose transport system substrate-binding protein
VVGIVAGLLVLCGGAAAVGIILVQRTGVLDQADDPVAPSDADQNTGPIQWLSMQRDQPALDSVWGQLADEFAATSGTEVQLDAVPRDAYLSTLTSSLESGEPPDLFDSTGGIQLREQVERGLVRDLTGDLSDVIASLPPGVLDPYTVDGRVYGLPYHTGVVGLWYNRALFADAGLDPDSPPETWSDFLAALDRLKAADIVPVAIAGVDPWTMLFWYGCLATRVAGVDAFVAAGAQRSLSANPDYLRAAELLDGFIRAEPFQPNHESASYAGPGGSAELVGNGVAAMELMGSWAPGLYEALGSGGLGDDLGWFPFPAVEGGNGSIGDLYGGGDGFAVGIDAPDATIELLRYLFSEPSYAQILEADPSLIPVQTDTAPPADPIVARQIEAIQSAQAMQLYLDSDVPFEASDELFTSMEQLLVGGLAPADMVTRVTDRWQDAD